jgi:diguanylate cyclase (GGDEF)-like protein
MDKQPLSVALLDIDLFKRINDEYGHQVGDDVLIDFALVLKKTVRPSDRIYRWGGEEFLILLPHTTDEFSSAVCNRILMSLSDHNFAVVGNVTASIGLASMRANETSETVLQRADEYLYQAKDNGRNQVVMNEH